jgi:hypothetical protein
MLRFFAASGGDAFEKRIDFFVEFFGFAKKFNKKINPFLGNYRCWKQRKTVKY